VVAWEQKQWAEGALRASGELLPIRQAESSNAYQYSNQAALIAATGFSKKRRNAIFIQSLGLVVRIVAASRAHCPAGSGSSHNPCSR
jgi:hypothetical protein